MDVLTLDIAEAQIIVEYPDDEGGFYWHARVLLEKVSPGVWVSLTPDMELCVIDLRVVRRIVLGRRAEFPAPQRGY
eukprot:5802085-Lingulodinium_polyedra.AAC.1